MDNTRNTTCKARIASHKRGEMSELLWAAGMQKSAPDYHSEDEDPAMEYINSLLCVDDPSTQRDAAEGELMHRGCRTRAPWSLMHHWQASWGGPGSGIIFYTVPARNGCTITAAYYYFQDWYDGAHLKLTDRETAALQTVFDYLDEFKNYKEWEVNHSEDE